MARKKYSGGFEEYESKLKRVMERLGVKQYKYDWSRKNALLNLLIKINITVLNIRFIRRRNINRIYIIHRTYLHN